MNVPAPTLVKPEPHTVHTVAVAAGAGGTPLAIFSVLLWETATGQQLDAIKACALGSLGASVFAYLWHVGTRLIEKHLNLS